MRGAAKEKCFPKFTVALAELVAEGLHVDAALVGELHRDVLDDDASSLRRSKDLKKTGFRRDLGVGLSSVPDRASVRYVGRCAVCGRVYLCMYY